MAMMRRTRSADSPSTHEVPHYQRPTEASTIEARSALSPRSVNEMVRRLSLQIHSSKGGDCFKSVSGEPVVPHFAMPTQAFKGWCSEGEEDMEPKKSSSPRAPQRVKKGPASENPRYRTQSAPPPRSQDTDTEDQEDLSAGPSPVPASPDASTASPPERSSPRGSRPNLGDFIGCEDPATFGVSEDEGWANRSGPRTHKHLHRPSSILRLGKSCHVTDFITWVESVPHGWENMHDIFFKESTNPSGGEHVHRGHQPMAGLNKKRWTRLMINKRYPYEYGLSDVFDEIAREVVTDKDRRLSLTELRDMSEEVEISLAQFKRFAKRVCCVNSVLEPKDRGSPASRFVSFLRSKYGSTLQAWRSMLDLHQTGRVSYTNFLNGCRKMGMASQGKVVWNNLKKDQIHPLEFHELDPEEGDNLEEWAKIMWDEVGLKLGKAWNQMDPMKQNFLTFQQFKTGCNAFGWYGKVRMLFKGLDSSGLGRIKKDDFLYISKVSHLALRRFGGCDAPRSAATELVSWCHYAKGGPDKLVELLEFRKSGPGDGMEPAELARRLEKLGFESDALEAANKVADGSPAIFATGLKNFLKCWHQHSDDGLAPVSARFRSRPYVEHRLGWDSGVDDIVAMNETRCRYDRGYFGLDGRQPITRQPVLNQPYAPPVEECRPSGFQTPITDHNPKWGAAPEEVLQPGPAAQRVPGAAKVPASIQRYLGDCSELPSARPARRTVVRGGSVPGGRRSRY